MLKSMLKQNHKFTLRLGAALVGSVAGSIASLTPFFIPSATANILDPVTINRRVGADYSICAGELLDREIAATQVAIACSQALIPADLSFCVTKINRLTTITAIDALSACTRVRRPVEMATCVVDIYNRTTGSTPSVIARPANAILDNCRRSLLPLKFADCVVGLSQQIDFSVSSDGVLRTCIAAEERR
jgi:hypothetical protein